MRDHSDVLVLADDPIAPGELAALAAQKGWQCSPVEDARAPAFRLFAASH
jgi:tRNA 2-thiouridine synthesizing protein A